MAKKKKTSGKKTAKKNTKLKKPSTKAGKVLKKSPTNRLAAKKAASKKKTALKKVRPAKIVGRKVAASPKEESAPKKQVRRSIRIADETFPVTDARARSGGQSGDLQGLSNVDQADSESVDELLAEGNAFEADVVSGVEDAGNSEGKEVHTHEVPEDDIPGEYLDEK